MIKLFMFDREDGSYVGHTTISADTPISVVERFCRLFDVDAEIVAVT